MAQDQHAKDDQTVTAFIQQAMSDGYPGAVEAARAYSRIAAEAASYASLLLECAKREARDGEPYPQDAGLKSVRRVTQTGP